MHRALFLEEILRVICCRCFLDRPFGDLFDRGYHANDLVAFARTCRLFKNPALDILWAELKDATPLARCLPEVCTSTDSALGRPVYMFKRRLKETERETVRSYTRRVRSLTIVQVPCLDLRSLEDLCLPTIADPLFPNIRRLSMCITDQTLPLIHHVFPSMLKELDLYVTTSDFSSYGTFFKSLATNCPNVNMIRIPSFGTTLIPAFDAIMIRHICRWTHLQEVDCSRVSLDIDALLHLSRMPRLTVLAFTLGHELTKQISTLNHPLTFSRLGLLRLFVASIAPISNLLLHLRLPAIISIFAAFIRVSPSKEVIRSFLTTLQEACTSQAAMGLFISHHKGIALMPWQNSESGRSVLTIEDMRYFAALNLNGIYIDLDWVVDLKDDDLLQIASACPQLVSLHINEYCGWRGTGITPTGLARFLQQCRCLCSFGIALDTRSPPPLQTSSERFIPCMNVDVLDSPIEADSVPAMAAFFADLFPSIARGTFHFKCWGSYVMRRQENWDIYAKRWQDVYTLAKQKLQERPPQSADAVESCIVF